MTASQIAEVLGEGVSRNAVIGKAHRLGLQARPSPVKGGGEAMVAEVVAASVAKPAPAARPAPAAVPPRTAPAPVVKKAKPAVPGKPARTTLLDLSEKVCKWPIGHPGDSDFPLLRQAQRDRFPVLHGPLRRCLSGAAAAPRPQSQSSAGDAGVRTQALSSRADF